MSMSIVACVHLLRVTCMYLLGYQSMHIYIYIYIYWAHEVRLLIAGTNEPKTAQRVKQGA